MLRFLNWLGWGKPPGHMQLGGAKPRPESLGFSAPSGITLLSDAVTPGHLPANGGG